MTWLRPTFPLLACAALALSGCGVPPYGHAKSYTATADPIPVTVPPNARSIAQQFRPHNPGGDPSRGELRVAHQGLDVNGPTGTPILAAAPGVVRASFTDPLYGQRIVIDHGTDAAGRRVETRYLHLASRAVGVGDRVARGQQIGGLGGTGLLAAGPAHLHFEVWVEDSPGGRLEARDPNLFWAPGPGRVICFRDAPADLPPTALTYPVICR